MAVYLIANGPSPTTAAQVAVATGTDIKTMLQVEALATGPGLRVIEWAVAFDGIAPAAPPVVELIETDVAATVTAHVASGIVKYDIAAMNGPADPTSAIPVGTASTGYTASAEGTITELRPLNPTMQAPTTEFMRQFPFGREPYVAPGKFLRIRVHAAADVNCICSVLVEEYVRFQRELDPT